MQSQPTNNIKTKVGTTCALCGVETESFRCGRCRYTFYCSKECQSKHWENHKQTCKKYEEKPSLILWAKNDKGRKMKCREIHIEGLRKLKKQENKMEVPDEEFLTRGFPPPPGYNWLITKSKF